MAQRTKLILFTVAFLALSFPFLYILSSLYLSAPDESAEDTDFDLVMGFYISGDRFSDSIINDDISDTIGLSNEDLEIVYLVDYDGFSDTEFFRGKNYTRDYINITEILPYDSNELNMGSQEVFSGFVDYLFSIPANDYVLVLWGHGKGYDGVCIDDGSSLSPGMIHEGLTDHDLDLLIFDACDMMNAETLFELGDSAQYVMGTQKDLPDRGLNYFEGIINYLQSYGTGVISLSESIADATIGYYRRNPSRFSVQLSAIDTLNFLGFSQYVIEHEISDLHCIPDPFESGNTVDLFQLLLLNNVTGFEISLQDTILYNKHLGSSQGLSLENANGISIGIRSEGSTDYNPFLGITS